MMDLLLPSSIKAEQCLRFSEYLADNGVANNGVIIDLGVDEINGIYFKDPSPEQTALANQLTASFDWSEATHNAWKQTKLRHEAFRIFMASNDPPDVMLRTIFRDIYTQINDVRELIGQPRILEPEIVARIFQSLQLGLGEV